MNVNIKTDEASLWIEEVKTEIDCVALVLKQTKECLDHEPDDDIWFEFERIVNNLGNYWDGLIKVSKDVCEVVKGTISEAERLGSELVQHVKDSLSQMRG